MLQRITLTLLFFFISSAYAAPVQWTLHDVSFVTDDEYRTLTGSFYYDADTNEYSNISFHYDDSSGYPFPDFDHQVYIWGHSSPGGINADELSLQNGPGQYNDGEVLHLAFSEALTGSGGQVALDLTQTFIGGATFLGFGGPGGLDVYDAQYPSYLAGGYVSASVVPIPAAAWLFGSALAGLGWIRRRPTA